MNRINFVRGLLSAVLVCGVIGCAVAEAADLRPSWSCLPEETFALVRVPHAGQVAQSLRERTKLGAVVLSERRFAQAIKLLAEQDADEWEKARAELGKYGFSLSDFPRLFGGEMGYALLTQPRGDRFPAFVGLAWIEPEGDMAQRIVAAIEKGIAEQETDTPIRRIDVQLAGQHVMRLALPHFSVALNDDEELPEFQTIEEFQAWQAQRAARLAAAPKQLSGLSHTWIARIENRLLIAHTFWSDRLLELIDKDTPTEADFEAVVGMEEAEGVMARFLDAHTRSADPPPLPFLSTPGLQAALPAGLPVVEGFLNLRPLFNVLLEDPEQAEAGAVFRELGIHQMGPMGIRVTLDDNLMRTGTFLSLPAPRVGLARLLEQERRSPEPPAWVDADLASYEHFSFDLGRMYALGKEIARLPMFRESAEQVLNMAEAQVKTLLRVDLDRLLESLGGEYWVVRAMPRLEDDELVEAQGVVWRTTDEASWKNVLQAAAPFIGAQVEEEQGFAGLRIETPVMQSAVFVGQGHLVISAGAGGAETLLSSLRNPPGGGGLRASETFRRAAEMVPPKPALYYRVTNASRYLKLAREAIEQGIDQQLADELDDDPDTREMTAFLRQLKALLPSEEELDGVLGVGVDQVQLDDQGVIHTAVSELPAP